VRKRRLSKAETRILEQFWQLGTSSVREILESLPEEERVAYTTVQTLVYRLEQKGALRGGATMMVVRLLLRLQATHRDTYQLRPRMLRRSLVARGVPVRFSGTAQAPSVEGFLRPSISLPNGIGRLLSKPELHAVLMHEVTHAKRRDNLIGLIQEVVLCGLWFHPLAWLTAFRLALYRELSCDDSVMAKAHGAHLVTALAKLAHPEEPSLLQARASSFMRVRVARLMSSQPETPCFFANALLATLFGALLLACILGTIVHTAHCFVIKP